MPPFKDLTGKRFGRLLVLYRTENRIISGSTRVFYHCRCDCGREVDVQGGSLRNGLSHSCGCLQRESAKTGNSKRTHGMTGTRIHRIWKGLNCRCNNKNHPKYSRYGERGITVCDEWSGSNKNGFINFYKWAMENGYSDLLTIDRMNNDGNYCPENCRWTSVAEQDNNKSTNRYVSVDGQRKTVSQWSSIVGIPKWKMYRLTDDEIVKAVKCSEN